MNPKTDMTFGKTNAKLFRKKGNKGNGTKQRILDTKKPLNKAVFWCLTIYIKLCYNSTSKTHGLEALMSHIAGSIGYKTQERVTLSQIEGKIFGAVMTLIVVTVASIIFVGGLHSGLQKTEANLKSRYETTK